MTEETAEPVPIHTKRIMARNSAASCLKVQSRAMVAFFVDYFVMRVVFLRLARK
jgi:hypothetical protein